MTPFFAGLTLAVLGPFALVIRPVRVRLIPRSR